MQTVGEMLRDERERKGLTLKEVEIATNIRPLYLNAIEEGTYSVLPGEAYVKGFIRNYANALGLNGSEYVELYRKGQEPATSITSVESAVVKATVSSAPPTATEPSMSGGSKPSKGFLLVCVVLVLAGGIWWVMSDGLKESPVPQNQAPLQAQQQPAPPSVSQQQQAPPQAIPIKPVGKPVVIVAKFINRSWVQVIADEKQVYQGIPQIGEVLTWQAEQKIAVKVGNAGAVEVTHNGQSIGKLGDNGEVVLKTFTTSGRQ